MPDDALTIRDLTAADATRLVALFERCYGNSYGHPDFYDAAVLRRRIESGTLRSVVALAGEQLLGHTGIAIHRPGTRACETGHTVVDPAARGRGLLQQLGAALHDRVKREGFCGYVHYPTTAHDLMQRIAITGGGVETGIMLAYVPEATEYRDIERPAGRLAATVVYQPLAAAPAREVHVPERYRRLIAQLYAACGLTRQIVSEQPGLPHAGTAQRQALTATWHESRSLLHLHAADFDDSLADAVHRAMLQRPATLTQVDLCMSNPVIGTAADALVDAGFIFCAVLPEYGASDVLRLQALRSRKLSDFHPNLVNPTAQKLCQMLRLEASMAKL